MMINGLDKNLSHEMTIVVLRDDDGNFYAQSSSLCRGKTADIAVRRCVRCAADYEFARRYDLYKNGEIDLTACERRPVNTELHKCL